MSDTYIVLVSSVVGSTETGFEIVTYWDGKRYATKGEAIDNGFERIGCDDFNIGVVRGGALVEKWWMDHLVPEPADVLSRIAREIGLVAA